MKPRLFVPQNISELLDYVISMQSSAPKFIDTTGYFPYLNLDHVFQELNEGLKLNRRRLGDERYARVTQRSARIRAHFEADPENKTGETLRGCEIIREMEDVLRQVRQTG